MEPKDYARQTARKVRAITRDRIVTDRVAFVQSLAKGRNVLDVGCVEHSVENERRSDWLHRHIADVAASVFGIDSEQEEVERLRGMGYEVACADATDFDLGRQFDVIVAGEVLEHLLDARRFLQCAKRHLCPGGVMVLTVPNANSLNYFLQNLVFGYEVDGYDHVSFYTPLTIYNLLTKCGLRAKEVVCMFPDTSRHHRSLRDRIMVRLVRVLEMVAIRIRPSLCRQVGVIAEVSSDVST